MTRLLGLFHVVWHHVQKREGKIIDKIWFDSLQSTCCSIASRDMSCLSSPPFAAIHTPFSCFSSLLTSHPLKLIGWPAGWCGCLLTCFIIIIYCGARGLRFSPVNSWWTECARLWVHGWLVGWLWYLWSVVHGVVVWLVVIYHLSYLPVFFGSTS